METEQEHSGELVAILDHLDKLEGGLIDKFNRLLKPILLRLEDLVINLLKTAQKVKEALSLSLKHSDKIGRLQEQSDKTFEQTGNKSRFFNLKLRGLAENVENSNNLALYLSFYLISSLKMEDVSPPLLFQPYRICRVNNPMRSFPRDIIITFCSFQVKQMVFDYAKENNGILHYNDKIHIYLDLAPEALAKHKELREIIAILRDAHVRFRWAGPLKLLVFYKNLTYTFLDEESGLELLHLLNLSKPPRPEKASYKRRLQMNASPSKDTPKITRTDIGT